MLPHHPEAPGGFQGRRPCGLILSEGLLMLPWCIALKMADCLA